MSWQRPVLCGPAAERFRGAGVAYGMEISSLVEGRDRAAFAAHELYEVQARLARAREAWGG
jgi:hypothetical protein